MDFKNLAILAPMAGATDSTMRLLCFSLGADMAVTEMVSAKAVCYGDEKTGTLASVKEGEGAVSVQLFGHEPEIVAEAAIRVAEGDLKGAHFAHPPAAIDINMGCPVRKIVTSGDGCAMMNDPANAALTVKRTVDAMSRFNIPVTVKIRSGWDRNSINAPYFAAQMEQAGASAVAVHARTREQMYAPSADPKIIRAVKDAVSIPVIGNGDIKTPQEALRLMEYTGCDSVMIGRAALGYPWIFAGIRAQKNSLSFEEPSREERVMTALSLIAGVIEEKGEYVGVRESRTRASYFIKGMRGSAEIRDRINHAETYSEIENILKNGLLAYGED